MQFEGVGLDLEGVEVGDGEGGEAGGEGGGREDEVLRVSSLAVDHRVLALTARHGADALTVH